MFHGQLGAICCTATGEEVPSHNLRDLALDCLVISAFATFFSLCCLLFGQQLTGQQKACCVFCFLLVLQMFQVFLLGTGLHETQGEPGRHNLCPLKLKGHQGKPWRGITISRLWESCGRIESTLAVDKRQGFPALEISEGYSEKMAFELRARGRSNQCTSTQRNSPRKDPHHYLNTQEHTEERPHHPHRAQSWGKAG